ncbi:MAG: tRNA pseudouridine55 synthase [Parcubacteria group bacterium Gr01-1014_106]|nr:MAG: tRNA pseudouridine55 synthase [Parcubacteria group bacterium Gr01-1014_106]
MDGFFLVDKPEGMTSHDVVARIRRLLKTRVGHAGTLDPMATGLLLIGVGNGTKALGTLTKLPKTYEAEVTLGATSDTDDREGRIQATENRNQRTGEQPTRGSVESALQRMTGTVQQTPPTYSAIKIRGVPAYRRMRRGESVTLSPREITVYTAELLSYAYPVARMRWVVSSGTYVRSLARDLGEKLGTGAYLSALRRTTIGSFRVEEATPLSILAVKDLHPLETLDKIHDSR